MVLSGAMPDERRHHQRFKRPLEGSWRGASGATRCRINDISASGCFLMSLAMPAMGESTAVTIEFPGGALTLKGEVAYAERGMGFAVKFVNVDDEMRAALEGHLATLQASED